MGSLQDRRVARLDTPLGDDALLVKRVEGSEGICELFRFAIDVSGDPGMIEQADLLGRPVRLQVDLAGDRDRWLHGHVTRLVQTEAPGTGKEGGASYTLEIRPWLWMLTQRTDSRIFQELSAPDIVRQVFDGLGFTDYELRLVGQYDPRLYCVQYQETDFDFVARLLEEEGIFWYFEHDENRHTLVMTDAVDKVVPLPGTDSIEMWHGGAITSEAEERLNTWEVSRALLPGKYAMTDYNFHDPATDLAVGAESSVQAVGTKNLEIFEYPGDFVILGGEGEGKLAKGDGRVKLRQEEGDARHTVASASSTVRAMMPGYTIRLAGHPVGAYNQEWLIVQVEHEISEGDSLVDEAGFLIRYVNRLRAVPAAVVFRPRRRTPRPRITGPQTAVVVGPQGEELYVDKFGRVKVAFHWDRHGARDETASCWVRVSQHWAGKGWGTVYHPRIGQEVVVEFLEGNPDRPLITGRVYNGANAIPYSSPQRSGILTRSTKGGTAENANELRFDDTRDSEEVYLHAEKNMNRVVENDDSEDVGANQTSRVGENKTVTIGKEHTETIGKGMSLTVGEARTMTVGKALTESVGEAMSVSVAKELSESIGESRSLTVGKDDQTTVGENRTVSVGKSLSLDVGESRSLSVGKNMTVSIGGNTTHETAKNHTLKAKKITIEAQDELQIKVGKAQITLKKDGTVQIKGKDLSLKGDGDITIKGKQIAQN